MSLRQRLLAELIGTFVPRALASCSFNPTRATSGSVKVAQGITE